MVGWNSERLESPAYRASIGQLLSQFMYGEEVSYTVAPVVMEHFEQDSIAVAALQAQLDDEVRHHGMFDEQRRRLSLTFEPPCDGMVDLGDRIRGMMRHGDIVGLLFAGSFMLEGLAFTTLSAYSEVSEPEMGKMLVDIMEDEGRHISLNMSLLKRLMGQDPSVAPRLVELHRETLPALFKIFSPKLDLARDAGLDGAWLLTRSMFHHAQRIRRLHLSRDMAHTMLEDSARVLATRS
jgi:hypothetical protein